MAGKEKKKVGRPPNKEGKVMTPAERTALYRRNLSNLEKVKERKKNNDRKNEKYA